jgi:DNA-binding IclR family transcriptional regulator
MWMTRPAAENILRLINFLAHQSGPVTASRIAQSVNLPRSTVYDLLGVAIAQGYAVHIPEKRRYTLGLRAFELGSGYQRQQPLVLRGTPLLKRLVSDTRLSAHLAVLHGTDVIYLVEERTRQGPWLVSEVGVRLPAHLTATGRAILAHLPPAQLRALYPSAKLELVLRTSHGPSSVGELRRILSTTRRYGYALEHSEVTEGLSSIARPVFDHTGWPIASVALTGAHGAVSTQLDQLVSLVSSVATKLSSRTT